MRTLIKLAITSTMLACFTPSTWAQSDLRLNLHGFLTQAYSQPSHVRGSTSLSGPSGLSLFPTAGTLAPGDASVEYSLFLFETDTDVLNNNLLFGVGYNDRIELGLLANATFVDTAMTDDEFIAAGPYGEFLLYGEQNLALSLGASARFGDEEVERNQVYLAGAYVFELDEGAPIASPTLHAGIIQEWFDDRGVPGAADDSLHGYVGFQMQVHEQVWLHAEISSKDSDVDETLPYAVGCDWRIGGVNMRLAGIQDGSDEDLSLFFGLDKILTF